ncbi:MAG TPA: hypothetical protein VEK08_09860 [Planctomycetota bacterium]|nr:hypothetical protein [Planctomycetota bacterium]
MKLNGKTPSAHHAELKSERERQAIAWLNEVLYEKHPPEPPEKVRFATSLMEFLYRTGWSAESVSKVTEAVELFREKGCIDSSLLEKLVDQQRYLAN